MRSDAAGVPDLPAAARYLNTTVRFVRRLIEERRIAFYRLGQHVRLAKADLDSVIETGRVEPTAQSIMRRSAECGVMAGKRDWGRIRQLPSGRWQARYPGRMANPDPRRRLVSGRRMRRTGRPTRERRSTGMSGLTRPRGKPPSVCMPQAGSRNVTSLRQPRSGTRGYSDCRQGLPDGACHVHHSG
ncbi:MAG: excisionase family DNA-binding protein [Pseudonocardiaceae bacterium]